MRLLASLFALSLIGCSADKPQSSSNAQAQFFSALSKHCGEAYAGNLVSTDAVDADFGTQNMIMHVATCSPTQIQIPFSVGGDRSRTWIITKTDDGLRLKHRHAHKDGSLDAVTHYGGDTAGDGTPLRQEFPVDQYSIDLFLREGLDVSITNVWAVEVTPQIYAYELSRENRFFRVEFDLENPVPLPEKPW